ncbi:MAG: transporter substrate-binding domain-containing protein [Thermoleophilia bacterium]|nr:transporter substrate-binding domain-containing protein [Thermoleophilia bacterium]
MSYLDGVSCFHGCRKPLGGYLFRRLLRCLKRSFGERLRAVLAIATLALLVVASSAVIAPSAAQASARDHPIIAGAPRDYPPFCLVNSKGLADGFSVQLLRAALAAVGEEVVVIPLSQSQLEQWLSWGTTDVLPFAVRDAELEQELDFSSTYFISQAVVVTRKDAGIHGVKDLEAQDVAVVDGDPVGKFLAAKVPEARLHVVGGAEEALRLLADGTYDAAVTQQLAASWLLQKTGLKDLHIVGPPIADFQEELCFAVLEGNQDLLTALNRGLAAVMADGTYQQLYSRWARLLDLPTGRPIVVGGDANFPPFEYLDDKGRPAGYNVELTYAVAAAVGIPVEIRLGPWADMRQALMTGSIDALQGMFYSPERDEFFDFSVPHLVTNGVAVVRQGDRDPPASVEELKGLRVAVERGDIMHDWASEQGLDSQLVALPSVPEALAAVSRGEADCALVVRPVALYYIAKSGLRDLVVGKTSLLTPEYCFAVKDGRGALLAQFSEGLALIKQSGEYRRIYEKWLGVYEKPRPSTRTILRYVGYAVGPLVVILLAVLAWLWALRREVARRTKELKSSEEQLVQAQKMEAVGRLAGGIAHDFNNLLTAILGYSELLLADEQACSPEAREDVLEIKRAAERGSSLTRQILAFSRRQPLHPEVVCLNDVIESLAPLLRRTLGEDVELVVVKDPNLGFVEVDVHQFEQVIMNLAINARDAMPTGGRLVIETSNVELDAEYARTHPEVVPGSYVAVAVSDTGTGIDKSIIDHIFEPFFTTKEPGQGTGLGLAVAYGIVRQSRGYIFAYSEPGMGATFRIYLPRIGPSPVESEPRERALAFARGKEAIVVVEDEPALCRLTERVLTEAGYRVTCFQSADEALAAIEDGAPADLMITDVVLPGLLQGPDLAARVRELRPDLPVVFMSGYPRNAISHGGRLEGGVELIEKPFTPESLLRKVREALDRTG